MEMSLFTDYALRTLIYAGLAEDDRLASVRSMADSYGLSQHHLVKVVHRLSKLGYVSTFRGRGGGFRLALEPEGINVGRVVRQIENLSLVECLTPSGKCCIAPACQLKKVLLLAREAFLKTLDNYSLADLLSPREDLRAALALV